MFTRKQWRWFIDHPVVEWTIFAVGALLMLAAIPLGALPGPGGIFVFAIGLAMVLKTSMWAKRHYVKFKRWQPKAGRWTDWGLRRRSFRRREAMLRERRERDVAAPALQPAEANPTISEILGAAADQDAKARPGSPGD